MGDILVVRHATAAVLPALALAAGAVCERGGVLNHLAVLARELGKPCVTGVCGIIDTLSPGAVITIDGTHGVVEVQESYAAEPPGAGEGELVAVMQFGLFGAAFEPLGPQADVATALSVAALASVPAAFGAGAVLALELSDGRAHVRRDRLRATVATLTDLVEAGEIDAGWLRARFDQLVSSGGGEALAAELDCYAEAWQLVWAASLAREPLAERYRAFLRERLAQLGDSERERLYLDSLILPGASYILGSALDGTETVWGARRDGVAARAALRGVRAGAGRARERLEALLPPGDVTVLRRYLAALSDLVALSERKNTDLHRFGRRLFASSASEAAIAELLDLEPGFAAGDERALARAVGTLARRLAQNRISTIPGRSAPG
ncbi:MAG: hypothetical protein IT201_02255 [Thermoleophilia bacterium]|nr:hypothetical protein [Thermoleophilia bacterium]